MADMDVADDEFDRELDDDEEEQDEEEQDEEEQDEEDLEAGALYRDPRDRAARLERRRRNRDPLTFKRMEYGPNEERYVRAVYDPDGKKRDVPVDPTMGGPISAEDVRTLAFAAMQEAKFRSNEITDAQMKADIKKFKAAVKVQAEFGGVRGFAKGVKDAALGDERAARAARRKLRLAETPDSIINREINSVRQMQRNQLMETLRGLSFTCMAVDLNRFAKLVAPGAAWATGRGLNCNGDENKRRGQIIAATKTLVPFTEGEIIAGPRDLTRCAYDAVVAVMGLDDFGAYLSKTTQLRIAQQRLFDDGHLCDTMDTALLCLSHEQMATCKLTSCYTLFDFYCQPFLGVPEVIVDAAHTATKPALEWGQYGDQVGQFARGVFFRVCEEMCYQSDRSDDGDEVPGGLAERFLSLQREFQDVTKLVYNKEGDPRQTGSGFLTEFNGEISCHMVGFLFRAFHEDLGYDVARQNAYSKLPAYNARGAGSFASEFPSGAGVDDKQRKHAYVMRVLYLLYQSSWFLRTPLAVAMCNAIERSASRPDFLLQTAPGVAAVASEANDVIGVFRDYGLRVSDGRAEASSEAFSEYIRAGGASAAARVGLDTLATRDTKAGKLCAYDLNVALCAAVPMGFLYANRKAILIGAGVGVAVWVVAFGGWAVIAAKTAELFHVLNWGYIVPSQQWVQRNVFTRAQCVVGAVRGGPSVETCMYRYDNPLGGLADAIGEGIRVLSNGLVSLVRPAAAVAGAPVPVNGQAFSTPTPVPVPMIEYTVVGMKIFHGGKEVGYAGMGFGRSEAEVTTPGMPPEVAKALVADYIGMHSNYYAAQGTEADPSVPGGLQARAGEYAVDTTAFAAAGYATNQTRRAGAASSAGVEAYQRIVSKQEMRALFGNDAVLQAYVLKATQEETYKQSVFRRAEPPKTRLQSGAVPRVTRYTQARLAGALGSDLLAPKALMH